jgi:hypothetical protein
MSEEPQQPKIIVDEDWKSRVQAEKETLSPKPAPAAEPPRQDPSPPPRQESPPQRELPPPDLTFIAGTMYMQALVAMGLVPNPMTGKATVQLQQAKHAIDTLDVLQRKTEGNRTADESEAIEAMLHELRLTFITVRDRPPQ